MDCSLPGSSVHGISQARILAWVAFSSPGDLPNSGIELAASALAGGFFATEPPGKPGKRIERVIFVYALRRGDYFKPSY